MKDAILLSLAAQALAADTRITFNVESGTPVELVGTAGALKLTGCAAGDRDLCADDMASASALAALEAKIDRLSKLYCHGQAPVGAEYDEAGSVVLPAEEFSAAKTCTYSCLHPLAPTANNTACTRPPSTRLSEGDWEIFGVSKNPKDWKVDNVGTLGTYTHTHDADNWSEDVRPVLEEYAASGVTDILVRIYDPVDPSKMDVQQSVKLSEFLSGLKHVVAPGVSASHCSGPGANAPPCKSVSINSYNQKVVLGTFEQDTKTFSVGTTFEGNPGQSGWIFRTLNGPDYVKSYCDEAGATSFFGTGQTGAINFMTGSGGYVHSTLCSTGLGVYDTNSYPAYNKNSDEGRRAAIAFKLPAASQVPSLPASLSSDWLTCGVAKNPVMWRENHVGMLGTHESTFDADNWSRDCSALVNNEASTCTVTTHTVPRDANGGQIQDSSESGDSFCRFKHGASAVMLSNVRAYGSVATGTDPCGVMHTGSGVCRRTVDTRHSYSSVTCRACTTNKDVEVRIYDPTTAANMDVTFTTPAVDFSNGLSHDGSSYTSSATCDNAVPVGSDCESINLAAQGLASRTVALNNGATFADFQSTKAFSVSNQNIQLTSPRLLIKDSYTLAYCDGGSTTPKYNGRNNKNALNFFTGGPSYSHATLCSTGLGMYGPSQCTTGSSYNCWRGTNTVSDGPSSVSDVAQRAAVDMKVKTCTFGSYEDPRAAGNMIWDDNGGANSYCASRLGAGAVKIAWDRCSGCSSGTVCSVTGACSTDGTCACTSTVSTMHAVNSIVCKRCV
jgi:hypothetical protein